MSKLNKAISSGNTSLSLQLIASGDIDFDYVDSNGNTVLMIACAKNLPEVALTLIQTGHSKPDHTNKYNNTALIVACTHKLSNVALALIETGQSNPGFVNDSSDTALIIACLKNLPDVALALIQTGGTNPGHANNNNNTALMFACGHNLSKVVLALIETGQSNPGHVNKNSATALILACDRKLTDVALALIRTSDSTPGQVSESTDTALMIACGRKLSVVAIALIETNQSNPRHVNKSSETALILACDMGLSDVALALIQTGDSNPGVVSNYSDTALLIACNRKLSDVALALIETGQSNPGYVSDDLTTALLLACKKKLSNVALALIQTGESNPGHMDDQKITPLMAACVGSMNDVAIALIRTGRSRPEQVGPAGNTAFTYAKENNMTEVMDLLKSTQPITQSVLIDTTKEGFDAIHQENVGIAKFLIQDINNMCFMIHNQCYLTNKETIKTQINKAEYIKYECKRAGSGAQYYADSNVILDPPYFLVSSLFGVRALVLLADIKNITDNRLSSAMFALVPSRKKIPSMMSQSILNGEGAVSGDHCQEGTEIEVLTIVKAVADKCAVKISEAETSAAEPTADESAGPGIPEPAILYILYKNVKYELPITIDTTVGELKTLFVQSLKDKGVLEAASNVNVKFIFGGKIFTDNSIAVTQIANPPFGATIQAMITPITAGGRARTMRNIKKGKHKFKPTLKIKTKRANISGPVNTKSKIRCHTKSSKTKKRK